MMLKPPERYTLDSYSASLCIFIEFIYIYTVKYLVLTLGSLARTVKRVKAPSPFGRNWAAGILEALVPESGTRESHKVTS